MKRIESLLSAVVLVGLVGGLTGTALAYDGILSKQELTPDSYCHLQFPAMSQRSLAQKHPTLKNKNTGDVIDFYGPCSESPTGHDQVQSQKLEEEHRFFDSYAS